MARHSTIVSVVTRKHPARVHARVSSGAGMPMRVQCAARPGRDKRTMQPSVRLYLHTGTGPGLVPVPVPVPRRISGGR